MKQVVMMVIRRSRSFSMVREAMTPGTPQPVPTSTGMKTLLHELHYRMLQGIDLFLLVSVEEHLGTAVNQESSEYE